MNAINYHDFVSRNHTYVPENTQNRIRETRLLIAGVGMGSTVAEAAIRFGFEHIALIDGDTVEPHNLNRQGFTASDIRRPKVEAMANRMRAINPNAKIREHISWLDPSNAAEFVRNSDFVVDAIDFLSLEAIVALHDECRSQGKPIVSVVSAGFGAMAIYFPPEGSYTIRDCFGLPSSGSVANASYVKNFAPIVRRLSGHLDPLILLAMEKTFKVMEDATPCPAPHIVVGSSTMAALAMTIATRVLQGEPVVAAPEIILVNLNEACTQAAINLENIPSSEARNSACPATK